VTPSASVCNRASGARPRARESVPAAPAQLTFRGRATTPYALLVVEPEFASVLRQTTREINTLSPGAALRWDGRPLALLTRTVPARASDAHINPIGRAVAMRALDFGRELSPSVVFRPISTPLDRFRRRLGDAGGGARLVSRPTPRMT
jgi:hypothetical protein